MMQSMTRWTLAGFMALVAVGVAWATPSSGVTTTILTGPVMLDEEVAVLDVGSTTAEAAPSVSPFAGSWSGTFSVADSRDPEFNRAGTFDWTISDEGRITGTFVRLQPAFVGTFVGHVGADGELMMIVRNEGGGVPHEGTAVIDGDGKLVVSATDTFWPRAHTWLLSAVAVLDVGSTTAEAAPSVSPFAGSWSGTWFAAPHGLVGTYDWTISVAGRITGTIYGITSGRSGVIVGHVGADGDLVYIRYVPNDEPATGYASYPFQGTAEIDGDGRLVSSVTPPSLASPLVVAILERN